MNDVFGYHVPMRMLYQEMLRHGDPPVWTPALFAGFDLHGEGQVGAFHPLHQILYRTLPLDLALNVEIVFTYIAAIAGMRWLLRRLGIGPAAALFGAMTFGFGGFMLTHYPHVNMLAVVAHLPWVLGCFDILVLDDDRERRAGSFAWAALLIASQALLGFPQALWWTLLSGSAFVIWRTSQAEEVRWGRIAAAASAVLVGGLIGGVQLIPTLAAAAHSSRVGPSRDFLLGYSLHPWNIVQLWSPYAFRSLAFSRLDRMQFHEFALYPASFLVIAPVWLWIRRGSLAHRRGVVVAAAVFAAIMFVLSLGRYGKLAELLLFLPAVSSLRAPARYIMLMQLALAVLAAVAIEDLAGLGGSGVKLSWRQVGALLSVAVLSVLTLLLLNTGLIRAASDVAFADVAHAGGGTIIVVAATALVFLGARGVPWALPAIIVFTAADLAGWGLTYIYTTPPVPLSGFAMRIPDNPGPGPMRLVGPSNWTNVPLMNGYELVGGYVGLYPRTTLSWESDAFRRLAGAKRRFDGKLNVFDLTDGVARARLLTDVRVSADPVTDIQHIDLQRTALLREPVAPLGGAPGTAQVLIDRPGHFVIHTEAGGRQLLTVSERFDENWTASIDGRGSPVIAVNADFLGVVVESGVHLVDLRYESKSLATGRVVSLVGLGGLAVGLFLILRGSP
ncbi:MAG TPA: hypothetical protein VFZ98_09945 [Vicinamibacterales bacterium]